MRNAELRKFHQYLLDNMKILPELSDIDAFKKKLWVSYLVSQKELYEKFLEVFEEGRKLIEWIVNKAKSQETAWREVVDIFKERFTVPFEIIVANQEEVILKDTSPKIIFRYIDGKDCCDIGRDELLRVLCTGEQRALYMLNIIFEIRAREKEDYRTILVFDDIADSFDYKNKFAIIEYLKEISETNKFFFIILTHNFDFFRTVQSRLDVDREHYCLMSLKTENEVNLVRAEYLHPFEHWKNNMQANKTILIAAIPMVRNLIEYTQGKECPSYLQLTSLLHQKSDSNSITLTELSEIFNKTLSLNLSFDSGLVLALIFQEAEKCLDAPECINLENKVVLSIAIRLLAEAEMIRCINDPTKTDNLRANQTVKLFKVYKEQIGSNTPEVKLLEQVLLMTPEPIHLNSFMYEPLIDLSDYHLKNLYSKVKAFSNTTIP